MDADRDRYQLKLLQLRALCERSHEHAGHQLDSAAHDAFEHGRYLFENKRVEEALGLYSQLALQHPTWKEAWLALGVTEFRLRKFTRAHTSLAVSWMLNPHDPLPLYYLGLASLRIDQQAGAKELFQQALLIASRNPKHFEIEKQAAQQLERLDNG